MADLKKITVSLPNKLIKELDYIVSLEKMDRNEFICDAMKLYIREREKLRRLEQLKIGYLKMAKVNIEFAEMGVCADFEDFRMYESMLSECE